MNKPNKKSKPTPNRTSDLICQLSLYASSSHTILSLIYSNIVNKINQRIKKGIAGSAFRKGLALWGQLWGLTAPRPQLLPPLCPAETKPANILSFFPCPAHLSSPSCTQPLSSWTSSSQSSPQSISSQHQPASPSPESPGLACPLQNPGTKQVPIELSYPDPPNWIKKRNSRK